MIIVPVGETHEDHPRVCGEKPSRRRCRRHRGGSPPRMRGKVTSSRRRIGAAGITPAYAGKSRLLAFELCGLKDHPRVCGEKCQPGPRSPGWAGSPPRMRGKARQAVYKDIKHGITPAYAGKRRGRGTLRTQGQDHPRVCGEKKKSLTCITMAGGSPPRMRGKATLSCFWQLLRGITPAYAGKSDSSLSQSCAHRDHPRVCGEK